MSVAVSSAVYKSEAQHPLSLRDTGIFQGISYLIVPSTLVSLLHKLEF
jgi:hypothetical protein